MQNNGLMSEFLGMHETLKIPMTENFRYSPPESGHVKKTAD